MTDYAKVSPKITMPIVPSSLMHIAQQHYAQLLEKSHELAVNQTDLAQYKNEILTCFAMSDFISRVALQYPKEIIDALPQLMQKDAISADFHLNHLKASFPQANEIANEQEAMHTLRKQRQLSMLKIAWCDICGTQTIETSLKATSKLANYLICRAYQLAFNSLTERFGHPENNQQLLILGMGKLGGEELNFSSDIDLIFTYPSSGNTQGGRKSTEHQAYFTKLAQKLIQLLDTITYDGQVYRVDMRLRPLGDSGPLVLPFSAFETYYQEQGRQWERFAMQKMRIINDTPFNDELYDIVQPFVYRKYIDYTTLESIREMKLLIEKEVKRRQISDNIKLGKGGIREVEFFVQSLQLIHGGRTPSLQTPSILQAMQRLQEEDLLDPIVHQQIKRDYLCLRRTEHFLQAFNDEQTQTLPAVTQDDSAIAIANKHNCDTPEVLSQDQKDDLRLTALLKENCDAANAPQREYRQNIKACMTRINQIFKDVIEDANSPSNDSENHVDASNDDKFFEDLWLVELSQEEFTITLCGHSSSEQDPNTQNLSESSAVYLYDCLTNFRKKTERSGVSQRSLKSINRLMPLLLSEFEVFEGNYSQHEVMGVFTILNTISGRVTYIDLLLENPDVRARLLRLCRKSLWVSEQIAQYPLLLDELLHPLYLDKNQTSLEEWKTNCADELRQTLLRVELEDVELLMETLRAFKHANQLRIAAADISGTLAINQVSDKLTLLAEVIMHQVIEYAWQITVQSFGKPQSKEQPDTASSPSKHFALIAYGKFGGIELSYDSDLDVVFLHNADLSLSTDNTGTRKQLSNQEFYIKLVQRISQICTTKTYSGILYDIDLRLRPSGNSGLLVSHIDSYNDYQHNKAWTWEHQAMVRSRAVYADNDLAQTFNKVRSSIIALPRDPNTLSKEVHEMRNKMREHLLKVSQDGIDLKQSHGGIVDIEFLVQYWVLLNGQYIAEDESIGALSRWSDNLRLLDTLQTHGLISTAQAQTLCEAYLLLRHTNHRVQLANQRFARKSKKLEAAMQAVICEYNGVFDNL